MSGSGYEAARRIGDEAAAAVRDLATLVGPVQREPVEIGGREVLPGLGMDDDARLLDLRAHDLEQGLFKIIVLGEFKNGKSTLLNAMLGNKTLPAKAAPATAIITMLVYGDEPRVAIYETGQDEPRMLDWALFVRDFQLSREDQETLEGRGAIDRFAGVEYALIECRHPICAAGVKLLDSPGLGEHVTRTRIATEFLKQSQAAIFVLNATKILSAEERTYIKDVFGTGRLDHVFFVVNRIDQLDPTALPEVRRWVESGLREHFLDRHGRFDRDLYERRVFFVNARGALEARMEGGAGEEALEDTGVPALEAELERFLTGPDKITAALSSTTTLVRPISLRVDRRVAATSTALDQPLAELEARRVESERRLLALDSRKREIERTILLFGDTIKHKIYASLAGYIDTLRDTWTEDAERMLDLDRIINLRSLLSSYAQPAAREEMSREVAIEIQGYLQVKFTAWAERVPAEIQRDLELLMAEVEAQVTDVQQELDEIAALFAAVAPRPGETASSARLLGAALGLDELGSMVQASMEPGEWTQALGQVAQQAIAVLVIGTFLTGGMFSALLIVEGIMLARHGGEVRKRVRDGMRDRLFPSLAEQVRERRPAVHSILEGKFRDFARDLIGAIDAQIDEIREEQERILAQKRDTSFSVEVEKERLATVAALVREATAQLEEITLGRQEPIESAAS